MDAREVEPFLQGPILADSSETPTSNAFLFEGESANELWQQGASAWR
jgi:hypothetical protein